jgi:hypothetical protein
VAERFRQVFGRPLHVLSSRPAENSAGHRP